jgi:hypothetical protein
VRPEAFVDTPAWVDALGDRDQVIVRAWLLGGEDGAIVEYVYSVRPERADGYRYADLTEIDLRVLGEDDESIDLAGHGALIAATQTRAEAYAASWVEERWDARDELDAVSDAGCL